MRGHIRKRGNKYAIVVDMGRDPVSGKRQQKWFSGYESEKEAEKAIADIISKIYNNNFISPKKITVKEYLEDWLQTYGQEYLAKTTLETYTINIKKHIVPYLGSIKLQDLKPIHIDKFLHKMLREGRVDGKGGLAKATVLKIHKILSRALNNALKLQLIEKNPAVYVEAPRVSNAATDVLTIDQIRELLNLCKGTSMEIPVNLAVGLGLRRGEVLGLQWSDISFQEKTLTVSEVLARTTKDVFLKEPKTEKSRRTLIVPGDLLQLLKKHRKEQMELKLVLGPEYEDHNLVCCRNNGQPINPSTFSYHFKTFLQKNNFPHIRFHDLRHTFATVLMANNVSPKIASSVLGHTNISTTMDLYSHVLTDMKKEVADKISQVIYSKDQEAK